MSAPARWRSITDTARLVGGFCYVELACFELAGSAAPQVLDDAVCALLAGAARGHAWRAAQLGALLPVSVGLPDASSCMQSPSRACDEALLLLAAALSPLAPPGAPGDGRELLGALAGPFLGGLLAAYESTLCGCDAVADPPLAAVLSRVHHDLAGQQAASRALLGPLAGSAPPPLAGSAPPPLAGSAPPPLAGSAPPPLAGSAPPPLAGSAPPPLAGSAPLPLAGSAPLPLGGIGLADRVRRALGEPAAAALRPPGAGPGAVRPAVPQGAG